MLDSSHCDPSAPPVRADIDPKPPICGDFRLKPPFLRCHGSRPARTSKRLAGTSKKLSRCLTSVAIWLTIMPVTAFSHRHSVLEFLPLVTSDDRHVAIPFDYQYRLLFSCALE
jgi:hypothetical protein